MKRGLSKTEKIILFIGLCLLAFLSVYFVFFMLNNSFKTSVDYDLNKLGLPKEIFLGNYKTMIFYNNILRLFSNSLIIVSSAIVLEIFMCSLAAYAFSKYKFKGKNFVFMGFISLMIVPLQVLIVPLYMMFAKFGLINTRFGIIIIYAGIAIPFGLYFLTSNFRSIPNEIIESAQIDGASYFRIYWSVVLPIGKTAIFTLIMLDFIWLWNELVLGLVFLQSDRVKTMTVSIATFMSNRYVTNESLIITALFLTGLPLLVLYSFIARFLMKGSTTGSVKG